MNITEAKSPEEILSFIAPNETKAAIIGCGLCATSCKTGGKPQIDLMKSLMLDNNKEVVYLTVVDSLCDERLVKKELRSLINNEIQADFIISMGCGSGNSTIADIFKIPVYPANNSLFLGSVKRMDVFEEKCSQCGSCITHRTGGICPVTRCPKGLINGPCGGSFLGKCEVDINRDCAWHLIYIKLKEQGKLQYMQEYHSPKSFRHILKPQKIDKRSKK